MYSSRKKNVWKNSPSPPSFLGTVWDGLGMPEESTQDDQREAFGTLKHSHVIFSLGKLLKNMLYWECKAARSLESFLCDSRISQSQKCYPSFIPVTEENCISCSQDSRSQYDIYLSNALDGRCWSLGTGYMCK